MTLNELEHDVRTLARVMFEVQGTIPPTFMVFAAEAMFSFMLPSPDHRDAAIEVARQLIREHDGDALALFSHGSGVMRGIGDPPPAGSVVKERDHFRCLFVYVENREGKRTSMAPIRDGKAEDWITDPRKLLVPLRVPEFFVHMRN